MPDAAAESLSVRGGRYAGGLRMPAHADGRSRLSVVLAGGLRERVGRVDVDAGVGFVAISPGRWCTRTWSARRAPAWCRS